MPSLADLMLTPHVAALLTVWLAPKDTIQLIVWAMENDLLDGACQLLVLAKHGTEDVDALRTRLVQCAAASGCRVAFERLHRHSLRDAVMPVSPYSERLLPPGVVYEAAKRGDLATVQWLSSFVAFAPHEAMAFAVANGYFNVAWKIGELANTSDSAVVQKLEIHGVGESELMALVWTALDTEGDSTYVKYFATKLSRMAPIQSGRERSYIGAMDIVASEGDVALIQTLHDDVDYAWLCTSSAMDAAASQGHLVVLQWLAANRTEGYSQAAMDNAARHGHVACMAFLRELRGVALLTPPTILAALEGGHLPVLAWIQRQPKGLTCLLPLVSRSSLVEAACVSPNRLRVLQWLDNVLDIRFATKPAISFVLAQGDVRTAQWLADPMGDGANLAHWDGVVAKWMSFEFALWHCGTFAGAAVNGHLHIVEWLSHAGSFHKVDADTLWQCAMRGHLQIVEFILRRPPHQPKDLVFLPHAWTSFKDSFQDQYRGRSWCCEWDPLACDPPWARHYVKLWLHYCPTETKHVPWLAEWANHCGHRELYERLCA